jgi:hypothetical protein
MMIDTKATLRAAAAAKKTVAKVSIDAPPRKL